MGAPRDRIRRGDQKSLTVDVPAAFAGDTPGALTPVIQFSDDVDRGWLIAIALQWDDAAAGVAGETLNADFIIEYGVASARINTLRNLNIAAGNPITVVDAVNQFPLRSVNVAARLRYTSLAGAARTFHGRVTVLCTPLVAIPEIDL